MSTVCPVCARRAWLIAKLSSQLDSRARKLPRLWPLLELPDTQMIEALGGRREAELRSAYGAWRPVPPAADADSDVGADIQSICRHHAAYPRSLRENALAPPTLAVRGRIERFSTMLDRKVVAIVGTRRASDYGMETARDLARGLAASGLTIASGLAEGIPVAAHSGALEADGATVTVMAGGVERCSPAWCRGLYRRIVSSGCSISETEPGSHGIRWWEAARVRTLGLLAQLVIVVEADDHPWELACARLAQAHGRLVAAVPGRISSPASRGANTLLMEGVRLVRSPQDALDVLYGVGVHEQIDSNDELASLEPRLRTVLERVGNGDDTMAKLTTRGSKSANTALALTELELQGLLSRGDGGRYVPSSGALAT